LAQNGTIFLSGGSLQSARRDLQNKTKQNNTIQYNAIGLCHVRYRDMLGQQQNINTTD